MHREKISGLLILLLMGCGGDSTSPTTDPGLGPWEVVAADRVREECGLDPALLAVADAELGAPYLVLRHGKICHEYLPNGPDVVEELFSATKTFSGLVTGIAAWETRELTSDGRKTGPLTIDDPVAHWLDEFTFNPEARVGHVLGMVAFNESLDFPDRRFVYDADGSREINRLSDVINTALRQDPERLGENLEEFTQRFVYAPLGMKNSVWTAGRPDKIFAFTWESTLRDMARVGLLILNGGEWNGERLLSKSWVYQLTHPSFEDANTNYGLLTWLSAPQSPAIFGDCAPRALWNSYPHGQLSEAPDCGYASGSSCEQEFDVGGLECDGSLWSVHQWARRTGSAPCRQGHGRWPFTSRLVGRHPPRPGRRRFHL